MDNAVLITFLIFWTLHISRRFLYYIYLWQLKSYRMDRLLEEISRNKTLLLPKVCTVASLLLLILAVAIKGNIFYYSLAIAYLLFGFYSLFLLARKRWRFPVFTKKIITIIALMISFGVFAIYYFSSNRNFLIPVFEILLPVFALAFLFLFGMPAIVLKKYTIRKARIKREEFKNLLVIGITGSYGKTSTKEFLYSILVQKYGEMAVLKTEKNLNTEIGIALAILNNLNTDHKFFICEMGAYKMGEIRESCQISRPRIGILTGINEQHMATFGSQENIIKGKYELIESLPPDGMAFFNVKNKYCVDLYDETLRRGSVRAFLYGENARFFGGENILGAMAVARELGMTKEEVEAAADKSSNKMPGIQVKRGIDGLEVIDSTYSANPDGVFANLEYLKNNFLGKKIIVMPCLIELGKASKEVHRRIGKEISIVCDLAIITTKDRFKEIKEGAESAEILPSQSAEIVLIENPEKIFEKIKAFLSKKNLAFSQGTVLLESRVPKKLMDLLGV